MHERDSSDIRGLYSWFTFYRTSDLNKSVIFLCPIKDKINSRHLNYSCNCGLPSFRVSNSEIRIQSMYTDIKISLWVVEVMIIWKCHTGAHVTLLHSWPPVFHFPRFLLNSLEIPKRKPCYKPRKVSWSRRETDYTLVVANGKILFPTFWTTIS